MHYTPLRMINASRIAQMVKSRICNLWIAGSSLTVVRVFFWYEPLASLSKLLAWLRNITVKNNTGLNQWMIMVKITPRL